MLKQKPSNYERSVKVRFGNPSEMSGRLCISGVGAMKTASQGSAQAHPPRARSESARFTPHAHASRLLCLSLVALFSCRIVATEKTQAQPPEINTLTLAKSGSDIRLNWQTTGTTAPFVTDHVLAHELTHLLIHYAIAPAGQYTSPAPPDDSGGHSTSNVHLMFDTDVPTAIDLTNADDILINNPTNPMRDFIFLPEGGLP